MIESLPDIRTRKNQKATARLQNRLLKQPITMAKKSPLKTDLVQDLREAGPGNRFTLTNERNIGRKSLCPWQLIG